MKNLVLFPSRDYIGSDYGLVFRDRFPKEEYDFIYVEDGPRRLEGYRFNDVYVHWYAYDEPGYGEIVAMILQARAFSESPGQTHLFT